MSRVLVSDLQGLRGCLLRRQQLAEFAHIDAEGTDLHSNHATQVVDADLALDILVGDAQELAAAREEVACVVVGSEAHAIRVEEGAEEVLADGDGSEQLQGKEGRVEEEPYAGARRLLPEDCGERPEVVVMDVDEILFGVEKLEHAVGELGIRGLESAVVLCPVADAAAGGCRERAEGVEPGPKVLAEDVVEVGVAQEHRDAGEALEEVDRELLGIGDPRGGGGEGADEDRVGEAAAELERERVVVEREIEAVRRLGVGIRAEGEAVGDDNAAARLRRRRT